MYKNVILFLGIILLIGCSQSKPTPIIYASPPIELPPDPIPATNKVTEDSTAAEVMKAWISTAIDYRGWNIAVRKLIENSR